MPESSGESFTLLLSNTQKHFMSVERAPLSAFKRREDDGNKFISTLFCLFKYFRFNNRFTYKPQKGGDFLDS